jgi:hypothetical protein
MMMKELPHRTVILVALVTMFAHLSAIGGTNGLPVDTFPREVDQLPAWSQEQIDQVTAWFNAKYHDRKVPFPPVALADDEVNTLSFISGVWEFAWQGNDSLHTFQVTTDAKGTPFRYIFTFTLSPGVDYRNAPQFTTWSDAFNANRLTQYQISRVNDADQSLECLALRKGMHTTTRLIITVAIIPVLLAGSILAVLLIKKRKGSQPPPGAYSSKAADGLTGNAQE